MDKQNWLRTWPSTDEQWSHDLWDRAYVADHIPTLAIANYDLLTNGDPSPFNPYAFVLEWDIALDRFGRNAFAAFAFLSAKRVAIAPYYLPDGTLPIRIDGRSVAKGETFCNSFGFGCVYLPISVIRHFIRDNPKTPLTDGNFSPWYCGEYGPPRIDWACRPQHIHGD